MRLHRRETPIIAAAAALLLCLTASTAAWPQAPTILLEGEWRFRIDPEDAGVDAKWFADTLPEKVRLPGSMRESGHGYDVTPKTPWTGTVRNRMWHEDERFAKYREPDNTKIMFWLQPNKHYVGPAWYQRDVTIPEGWRGKQVLLRLERCHWETQVWVDDGYAGVRNSLSVPHEYNLFDRLPPGEHTLTIRVDNTLKIDVGRDAHSVSDNTQSNWNGIVGAMTLEAHDLVRITNVQVFPDVRSKEAQVLVEVHNATGNVLTGEVILTVRSAEGGTEHGAVENTYPVELPRGAKTVSLDLPLGSDVEYWSEFSPKIYTMMATLKAGELSDARSVDFGVREFSTDGTQFTLNGQMVFLRGTLECCIFPRTGYPPTDMAEWTRILQAAKDHGLNHLRFHSWCPPEAAFVAADRMGFVYQVECAAWATIGNGKPVDGFLHAEGSRILRAYGNHPSFCMMAYGNEPSGGKQKKFLSKLVESWKKQDNRRLYTSAAGWPIIPENQFHSTPKPRVQGWGEGLKSRVNAKPYETRTDYSDFVNEYEVPVVSHEIGQWCVYPNLKEMEKYTGTLKARNFEIFRDTLKANHMLDQAQDFLLASGKLQALCYKEDIEAALRTPGFGGFQLLDLHDFPGQGTALVGVLDPFWEPKGYITAEEYRQFCGPTVPLLRMDKCVWTTDETFTGDVEIAHFGQEALLGVEARWTITDEHGRTLTAGAWSAQDVPIGNGTFLGGITVSLADVPAPVRLTVTVEIPGASGLNTWNLWVYEPGGDTAPPGSVHIAQALDEEAQAALDAGGRVLLLPEPGTVAGDERGKVPPGFSPIFWNTFWTNNQPPHTLGILCDPGHPALAEFPTAFHSDWQWWDLIHESQIMILDGLPPALRPVVQVIDDWTTNRRLGLVVEATVGDGRLLICGSDLTSNLGERPVARQMRRSLLAYMASDAFQPSVGVSREALASLFQPSSAMARLGAKATVSSEQQNYPAAHVIDGDPGTFWHTEWEPEAMRYPHWLLIELHEPVKIVAIVLTPRQDMANGRIGHCELFVDNDGKNWGRPDAEAGMGRSAEIRRIDLRRPKMGRFIRLQVLSPAHPTHPWAALAELDIVIEEEL